MKVFFRNIHLYLSLVAGLVIMVTCFTGAALVFEKELQTAIYPERFQVEATGSQAVSLEQMVAQVRAAVPGAKVNSVKIYADPARTVEIGYIDPKAKKGRREGKEDEKREDKKVPEQGASQAMKGDAKGEKKGPEKGKEEGGGGSQAFVNPYTGQLAGLQTQRNPFFFTMFSLHRWLLVGDTGKLIVGISTTIFLFILLTGIILWWPQNKKILKQRLSIKWSAGWKRLNHDWHIVLGFYSAIFLFAFAFTGLAWSFKWFNDGIYWVTGSENKKPEPPHSIVVKGVNSISFDQVYAAAKAQSPNADFYAINRPKEEDGAFTVMALPKDAAHEKASNQFFFDQYSGKLLSQNLYEERNLGQRVRATFYPVHVGSIGGLPGRIIAFLACIAGVTFPITGVIMWLNRLKKEKNKGKTKQKVSMA